MKYVENIFIHNLIDNNLVGDVAERFLQDSAKGREIGVTSVHTMVEIYAFLNSKRLSEQKISDIISQINEQELFCCPLNLNS
ncbi:MAG: hypothetical protein M8353_00680 [ANME-2 cluster archaeon]|nr:hypothetical protein [ANME-2 cluster archaeon]